MSVHPLDEKPSKAEWQMAEKIARERPQDLEDAYIDGYGLCLNCGEVSDDGVEPDACRYRCETCRQDSVFGAGEILLMVGL
jgi:hypothetical protein